MNTPSARTPDPRLSRLAIALLYVVAASPAVFFAVTWVLGYTDIWPLRGFFPILMTLCATAALFVLSRRISGAAATLEAREYALRDSETLKQSILNSALDSIISMDGKGRVVEFNAAAEGMLGFQRDAVIGRNLGDLIVPEEMRERHRTGLERYLASGEGPVLGKRLELEALKADGTLIPVELAITVARPRPDPLFTAYMRDISERRRTEQQLRAASEQMSSLAAERAAILGQLEEGVIVTNRAGRIVFVNDAATRMHGVARLDIEPEHYSETYQLFRENGEPYPFHELPLARAVLKSEIVTDSRWVIRRPDGSEVIAIGNARPVFGPDNEIIAAVLTLRDDTARVAGERALRESESALRQLNDALEERVLTRTRELVEANDALRNESRRRETLETQFRQMQKMEAVGQLTGGIAHDFNNMLAVIMGSLSLMKRRLDRGDQDVGRFIDAANQGAERAATLTKQLLAFSRQQALSPSAIDANKLVSGMSELVRRAIGENYDLETVLAAGLWTAQVDGNQLENAILNLAVNARDAMSEGGKISIETANCYFDDDYALRHQEVEPGQYVMVAVTDGGTGMSQAVLDKAFDPFFTTKPQGKGSGLGLSQVYGFVKQSGGHVKIYSEPGQGTTVKIYLPRAEGAAVATAARPDSPSLPQARENEVVLVVEDEDHVRKLSVDGLRELGYTVFEASNAADALKVLEREPAITLLFTDVVMPGENGRKLADRALEQRPGLKVLFTTGYTRNAIVHNGTLDRGVQLIVKPFNLEQLATSVRRAIGV
jgi:PAS domain S-box-containing protein